MARINEVIDYIDPNLDNNIPVNQEDLTKYVNLTVKIPSRDYNENKNVNNEISLLSGSNFKIDEKEYNLLTDSYVDVSYSEISKNGAKRNRELFGIKSIDVSFDPQFIPQVTMEFTDVRAFTLMGPTEQTYLMNGNKMENGENETLTSKDFFNAVFHFPYPKFTLYLKGYYGDSISFDMAVSEFNSRFNSSTGDFDVTIKFLGYMYGAYTDIPMSYVLASPYFNEKYWNDNVESGIFTFPSYTSSGITSGAAIPTYTEFMRKYADLVKCKNENDLDDNALNTFKNYNAIIREKNTCDEFLNEYDTLLNLMRNEGIEANDHFLICYERRRVTNATNRNNEFTNIVSLTQVDAFKKHIEKIVDNLSILLPNASMYTLSTLHEINLFNEDGYFFFKREIKAEGGENIQAVNHNKYVFNEKGKIKEEDVEKEYGLKLTNSGNTIGGKNEKNIANAIIFAQNVTENGTTEPISQINVNPTMATHVTTIRRVYKWNKLDNNIVEHIKEIRKSCLDEIEKKTKELDEALLEVTNKTLGFTFSVENIYRMLYAHLDTFVSKIYETVDNINSKENNEYVEELMSENYHVDFKRNKNGNNLRTKVPAFPLVAKEENGRRKIVYPGLITGFSGRPEIALVDEIFNKTKALREDYEDAQREVSDSLNETPSTASDFPYCDFIPLLMTDITIGGSKNPYAEILNSVSPNNGTTDADNRAKSILELLAIRLNTYAHLYSDNDNLDTRRKTVAKIEAFNLWKAFPDLDIDIINILTKPSSDNGTILETIVNDNVYNIKSKDNIFFDRHETYLLSNYTFLFDYDIFLPLQCNNSKEKIKEKIFNEKTNNYNLVYTQTKEYYATNNIPYNKKYDGELNNVLIIKPYSDNSFRNLEIIKSSRWYNENISSGEEKRLHKRHFSNYIVEKPRLQNDVYERKFDKNYLKLYKKVVQDKNVTDHEKAYFLLLIEGKENNELFKDYVNTNPSDFAITKSQKETLLEDFLYSKVKSCICPVSFVNLIKLGAYFWFEGQTEEFKKDFNEKIKNINTYKVKISYRNLDFGDIPLEIKDNLIEFFLTWIGESDKYNNIFVENEKVLFKYIKDAIIQEINTGDTIEEDADASTGIIYETITINSFLGSTLNNLGKKYAYACLTQLNYNNKYYKGIGDFQSEYVKELQLLYKKRLESNAITTPENNVDESNKEIKKSIYYTLKTIYDKWLCGNNKNIFKLRTPEEDKRTTNSNDNNFNEYKRLMFIDNYNVDISNEMIVDVDSVNTILSDVINSPSSPSFFSTMHEIAQKQKCLFLTLPVYNNGDVEDMFKPKNIYDSTHKLSTTGATYVVLYPGETSHILYNENDEDDFADDGFDIANMRGEITPDAIKVFSDNTFYKTAFGVTFGMQNQNYFKDIKISMDDPSITDYSIANTLKLAEGAKGGDVNTAIFLSNSLYPIFANRAYNCTVEMMGCAKITPLMYFQLNNIPMFRGAYIITNVSHKITPDDFTTTFTGTRIPKFNYEVNRKVFSTNDLMSRLNIHVKGGEREKLKDIVEKIENEVSGITGVTKDVNIPDTPGISEYTQAEIEKIVDVKEQKIVTFAQYPKENKLFDECKESVRKLLYDIAEYIKANDDKLVHGGKKLSIKVISGYRKGDGKSQHKKGEALDLQAVSRENANSNSPEKDRELNKLLFSILCNFARKKRIDQLIWEIHDITENPRIADPNTLHISCKENENNNRQQVLMGLIYKNKYVGIRNKDEQHPLFLAESKNI